MEWGPISKRLKYPHRYSREVQRGENYALAVVPDTTALNLARNPETRVNVKGECLMNLAHVVNWDVTITIDRPDHPTASRSYHSQGLRVGIGQPELNGIRFIGYRVLFPNVQRKDWDGLKGHVPAGHDESCSRRDRRRPFLV